MCSFKLTLMLKRVQCLAGLSFHYGALLFAGLSSLAPAQTREAKTENTLWQSCPPFYSGAFTIGTIVGQVNVSIQHVSRGILSTRCAHRCDGRNPTCLLGIFHWNKKKHRKRFSLYVFLSLSLFFFYNSDTIIRGIWVWVKVRKEVLFVMCIERKKKNRMQRHILTPRLFKNYLIYSAKVSTVI